MPSAGVINNPGAAFGGSAVAGLQRRQSFRNTSATAVVAGDLVVVDTSEPSQTTYPNNVPGANAIQAPNTADNTKVIGFAAEAAAAGAIFEVIVWGLAPDVNVATGATAGQILASTTTAGRAGVPTAASGAGVPGGIVGFVVGATAASNLADVFVIKG